MRELAGVNVVVTGAAGGIGASTVLEMARNGANIAALDQDEAGAKNTARVASEFGVTAVGLGTDITDRKSVEAAQQHLLSELGVITVLVNNAGIIGQSALMDVDADEWGRVIDVNLTGALYCSQVFGAAMRENSGGSLIHVSSFCAFNALPRTGAYSSSKAAVSMLSRGLALEWGQYGIRSNTIAPGMIRTPLTEGGYSTPEDAESRRSVVPLGRIGDPRDIADAAVWLASERSSYVTGTEIHVDGGLNQALGGLIPGRTV